MTLSARRAAWLMVALILVSAGLRLWQLPTIPPGLWYDEAYNGMDALRMLNTGTPQAFMVGNHGREPLIHYLSAAMMGLLGASPYTLRLVSALQSLVAVALVYRWLTTMFTDDPDRRWLALTASAGFAASFWYQIMSRNSYRAALVPLFVALTSYLFWRVWQRHSRWSFVAAGLALGLSQYTYLSARLLPMVFVLFGLIWAIMRRRRPVGGSPPASPWLGLLLMAGAAAVVFLPLGLFYLAHPDAFSYRTESVSLFGNVSGLSAVLQHLLQALRAFVDGTDFNWRHSLPERAGFDWLSGLGFWLGLIVVVRNLRRPAYLFLLISLLVMWLPAALAIPPVNALRLSGTLPAYYAIMAVGLVTCARWLSRLAGSRALAVLARAVMLATVLGVSGGLTAYDYFVRWADHPMVYRSYNGALVDMTRALLAELPGASVIMPFDIYAHPSVRFLLYNEFQEAEGLPPAEDMHAGAAILLVMPDPYASDYVWLRRLASGSGKAYLFSLAPPDPLRQLATVQDCQPFTNPYLEANAAALRDLDQNLPLPVNRYPDSHWPPACLVRFADERALLAALQRPADYRGLAYDWGHQVRLEGYWLWPEPTSAGQATLLGLSWRGLVDQPFDYESFVQIVNRRGEPVGQAHGNAVSVSTKQRWRSQGWAPEGYSLWLGAEHEPGPYLVRVGLTNPDTGERLPLYGAGGELLGDQLYLGLFYLADGTHDPREPRTRLAARLGDSVTLLGYSLAPPSPGATHLSVWLYWQASAVIDADYTVFVQLLDADEHLIAGHDAQPLAGLYPTSRWQPGETVADEFVLNLPRPLAAGTYWLVTGMYRLDTGQRLPAYDLHGQALPADRVVLIELEE